MAQYLQQQLQVIAGTGKVSPTQGFDLYINESNITYPNSSLSSSSTQVDMIL